MKDDLQKQRARQMRLQPTNAERVLWRRLRHNIALAGSHFRRQALIGPFIVDFASLNAKLVIELDGGQHTVVKDAARTRVIEARGYRILRFWNNDVFQNIEGVLETIAAAVTPTPDPSPQGGGEMADAVLTKDKPRKVGLLNFLATITPWDEPFPDVDKGLLPLRDIELGEP